MPDYNVNKFIYFPLTSSTRASVDCYNECLRKYFDDDELDLDDMGFYAHVETLEEAFGLRIGSSFEEQLIVVGKKEEAPYVLLRLAWGEELNLQKMIELKGKGATEVVFIVGEVDDEISCYEHGNVDILPLN